MLIYVCVHVHTYVSIDVDVWIDNFNSNNMYNLFPNHIFWLFITITYLTAFICNKYKLVYSISLLSGTCCRCQSAHLMGFLVIHTLGQLHTQRFNNLPPNPHTLAIFFKCPCYISVTAVCTFSPNRDISLEENRKFSIPLQL